MDVGRLKVRLTLISFDASCCDLEGVGREVFVGLRSLEGGLNEVSLGCFGWVNRGDLATGFHIRKGFGRTDARDGGSFRDAGKPQSGPLGPRAPRGAQIREVSRDLNGRVGVEVAQGREAACRVDHGSLDGGLRAGSCALVGGFPLFGVIRLSRGDFLLLGARAECPLVGRERRRQERREIFVRVSGLENAREVRHRREEFRAVDLVYSRGRGRVGFALADRDARGTRATRQ